LPNPTQEAVKPTEEVKPTVLPGTLPSASATQAAPTIAPSASIKAIATQSSLFPTKVESSGSKLAAGALTVLGFVAGAFL